MSMKKEIQKVLLSEFWEKPDNKTIKDFGLDKIWVCVTDDDTHREHYPTIGEMSKRLNKFIRRVCKEQRIECAKAYADEFGTNDDMSDVLVIETAQMPKINERKIR